MRRQAETLRIGAGDVNGFLGLVVDNLSVLALLSAVLIGGFGVPAEIVFGRMFPGTALGVLIGDLVYTWLAVRLARRTGRSDVTAMPFGLDTPSTIGMALLVLGPAYAKFRAAGLSPIDAGLETWYLGMAATAIMGALKLALAFAGRRVQRVIPQAGLLGSLAGIALMLIGFLPVVEILRTPIIGMLTLGLVLYALVGKGWIPGRMPGVLFAVLVGTVAYYLFGRLGLAGMAIKAPMLPTLRLALPHPDIGIVRGFAAAVDYLPLLLPFALLTVVGGVNNAESARVAGDDYDVRSILLGEAAATLIAGLAGGVAQTTPYIGHRAYKQMGARAGYTLLTGLFIGLGGMLGFLSNLIELIPIAVLAPVLVFVALDITVQAFQAVPLRHAPAVAMSFFPLDRAPRVDRIEQSGGRAGGTARAIAHGVRRGIARARRDPRARQRIHRHGDAVGGLHGRAHGAQAARGGLVSHRGRCARLLRDHPLGARGRQRLCAVAARGYRPRGGDAVLPGLLHPGGGLAAAVVAAPR